MGGKVDMIQIVSIIISAETDPRVFLSPATYKPNISRRTAPSNTHREKSRGRLSNGVLEGAFRLRS